jgi:hypothetical protein
MMTDTPSRVANPQANALADRLEQGAQALITFANSLTDGEWRTPVSIRDSRTIGVIVHHVASVYPIEIQLAQNVANGQAITGVTSRDIDTMNAKHSSDHAGVSKAETLEFLRRNSTEAAAAIRALSDEQLRQAAPVSLYEDAPLTSQFVLEDHAVRHSYHHLFLIRRALGR